MPVNNNQIRQQDEVEYLPIHSVLEDEESSIEDALVMIEKYPAALQYQNEFGFLPIHIECMYRCRPAILSKCIELSVESLAQADEDGYMPLHALLINSSSSIDQALMMIEKYPVALEHENSLGQLPLHIECKYRCRSSIIFKCIELYPESFIESSSAIRPMANLPLHLYLANDASSAEDALILIEKYPAVLEHQNRDADLLLHIECKYACRSSIISKCIEQCPESLSVVDEEGNLPLHRLLENKSSSINDALMMIEKYPAALKQRKFNGWLKTYLPLHVECENQCRSPIISKCISRYPESLDDVAVSLIFQKVNQENFHEYSSLLSMVLTARPMSLYHRGSSSSHDMRDDPYYRRRILHLLPRHVYTPTHDADYQDLNGQPRAAMMMLLSQMKI
jgi:ankyrin repeat protein